MAHWTALIPTAMAAFAASLVEFVEALTIILAVGIVRGWRSALLGAAVALLLLALLVAAVGHHLAAIPLHTLQWAVGTLLLLFGLRWLRKAVLRAAGVIALHDEAAAFAAERNALRSAGRVSGGRLDALAFVTSLKAVLLEGSEVVFIVMAMGAGAGGGALLLAASTGAALALVAVVLLGVTLHRPLARLPENQLKFGVAVVLTAFGLFWVGEGTGLAWPGGDWAVLALSALVAAAALLLVPPCRQLGVRATAGSDHPVSKAFTADRAAGPLRRAMTVVAKLFVDDGWLATGIVVWVGLAWAAHRWGWFAPWADAVALVAGLLLMLGASALRRASGASLQASGRAVGRRR